jgi:hypothetical protein
VGKRIIERCMQDAETLAALASDSILLSRSVVERRVAAELQTKASKTRIRGSCEDCMRFVVPQDTGSETLREDSTRSGTGSSFGGLRNA